MRVIQYRFTDAKDGTEYGGFSTTLKEAEKVCQQTCKVFGPWWSKNTNFRWIVLQFDRKTDAILEAMKASMHFAHDVHEIAPVLVLKDEQSNKNGDKQRRAIAERSGKRRQDG